MSSSSSTRFYGGDNSDDSFEATRAEQLGGLSCHFEQILEELGSRLKQGFEFRGSYSENYFHRHRRQLMCDKKNRLNEFELERVWAGAQTPRLEKKLKIDRTTTKAY